MDQEGVSCNQSIVHMVQVRKLKLSQSVITAFSMADFSSDRSVQDYADMVSPLTEMSVELLILLIP